MSRFAQQVLAVVHRLQGKAYGVTIRRELLAITGGDTSLGAIYVMLDQLEAKGWVTSHIGEANAGTRRPCQAVLRDHAGGRTGSDRAGAIREWGLRLSKVYHAIASARPVAQAQECFSAWRDMGYGTASIRDRADLDLDILLVLPEWPGLWAATNTLAAHVLDHDPECQIIVAAGDDVWPDRSKRADEIADEFVEHFHGTLGVMQPVGVKLPGHDRLCWSPWLGREWCSRAFCGTGADGASSFSTTMAMPTCTWWLRGWGCCGSAAISRTITGIGRR